MQHSESIPLIGAVMSQGGFHESASLDLLPSAQSTPAPGDAPDDADQLATDPAANAPWLPVALHGDERTRHDEFGQFQRLQTGEHM